MGYKLSNPQKEQCSASSKVSADGVKRKETVPRGKTGLPQKQAWNVRQRLSLVTKASWSQEGGQGVLGVGRGLEEGMKDKQGWQNG